ncbi:BatD family protein [Sulfurospirillum diekertiae]|uniref:BatD family protein n=1 Tax=Sulfurospirillum diekertiae TaxID=1854492 RepID=A0AA92IYV9_9BACT|nr:BatD family protein [Sulfurospirillum diekertiae]QIR76256.1 BatD family protein [Sulfurospirillum diekertiae]
MRLRGSLGLFFILTLELFGAHAFLLQPSIEQGESATLVLSAKGESIKFPTIDQIDGFTVVSHQNRQSIELNNGVVTKQLDHYVTFYPDRNVTIPAYEVIVDGKKELTESLHLPFVQKVVTSAHKEPFSFEMKVSNTTPMRHEGVKLSFIFKRNKNENLVDMRFLKPTLEGFWVKEVGKDNPHVEGDDVVHTVQYMIYPQKSGEQHIVPAKIEIARQVASREMFINQLQWKSISSNDLTLHVKPLDGVDLLGEFAMDMQVDKEEIAPNEAVNMTVKITGEGNFDDIEPFKLTLPNATVFSDSPKVTTWMEGEKLKGEFVQKFAINAQKSFEISPLQLRFYHLSTKHIESVTTDAKIIKVLGKTVSSPSEKGVAEEEKIHTEMPIKWQFDIRSFAFGLGGATLVVLLVGVLYRFKKIKIIPRRIQQRDILQKLLKYQSQNEAVDCWIEKLEANLYRGGKHPINRKAIDTLLEDLV